VSTSGPIPPDPRWNRIYRIAGLAMLPVGVLYLLLGVFTVSLRIPVTPGTVNLPAFAAHLTGGTVTFVLFMVTDLLLIPALLALYLALRGVNRPIVLVGSALLAVFIGLDLLATEPNWLNLYALAYDYVHASSPVQAAGYLASAKTALALVPITNALSYGLSSAGLLLISLALLRSVFGRPVARIGVGINAAGVLAGIGYFVPVFAPLITAVLFAFGLWMILLGARFYRYSVAHDPKRSSEAGAGRGDRTLGIPKGLT
jgi:hypothetical protein